MSNQLQTAITLIKSGDTQQGRQLLVELLKAEPKNELAWLWLSNVVSTDEQRRYCLKQVLRINPQHPLAQKGLTILQQKSQAELLPAQESPAIAKPDSKVELPQAYPPQSTTAASLTTTGSSPGLPDEPAEPAKALKQPDPQPVKSSPSGMGSAISGKALVKKRIWIHPKSSLYGAVILYDDGIAVLAKPDKVTLLQLAVSQEPPAREVLGPNLTWLPIHKITSIEADPATDRVYIRFTQNNRPALKRIFLANTQALDEFMNACQTNGGASFERTLKPYSMFAAMIIPLIAFGVVILLTYFLHGAAIEVAAGNSLEIRGGRRASLQYLALGLITLLGPTGVLIAGIGLAALTLFWMFARMLNPPTRTILTPIKKPVVVLPSASTTKTASTIQTLVEEPQSGPVAKTQGGTIPAEAVPRSAQTKTTAVDKPKKRGFITLLVRSLLVVFIFAALGWAGFLYLNRPSSSYPGLIEGGTAIDLSHRGLTDTDLRALAIHTYPQPGLVTLDISDNPLTELPPEIGQMANLENLYIKNTPLQTLPPEIGKLSNLHTLNLQDSQLTRLPPEAGQLYYLEVLDLQGNKLRALPLEISRLPNLRMLNIQRTMIQRLPPEFEQKPNLKILY